MGTPAIKVCPDSDNATIPCRETPCSAGLDLHSAFHYKVPARGRVLISTGLRITLPKNTYGQLKSKSGLSLRHALEVGAGVIDQDYRGIIKVLLYNHSDTDFIVLRGDPIAQLVVQPVVYPIVFVVDNLEHTKRGTRGFGGKLDFEIEEKGKDSLYELDKLVEDSSSEPGMEEVE